jgi:hypothetical protein
LGQARYITKIIRFSSSVNGYYRARGGTISAVMKQAILLFMLAFGVLAQASPQDSAEQALSLDVDEADSNRIAV